MIRINKYISSSGFSSRRAADLLIEQGRVTVNGKPMLELGFLVNPIIDKVEVDGRTIVPEMSKALIAFYKPRGVLSSMSGISSLADFVSSMPHRGLFHVGRLDRESEGLLILSNDGNFAQKLIHPSFEVEKEYVVTLAADFTRENLENLRRGIELEDGPFKPLRVSRTGPNRILLVMKDGRNRVIRRAMGNLGHEVLCLLRTRIGGIELGPLREGEWRYLKKHEKTSL